MDELPEPCYEIHPAGKEALGMTADEIATFQTGTHPVLTASPIGYQLVNAAEVAIANCFKLAQSSQTTDMAQEHNNSEIRADI